MMPPCTKSPDGRHNFNPETGDCAWQCGVNQRGKARPIQSTGLFSMNLERALRPRPVPKGIHSELHQLIAEMIVQFNEPPKIRIGNREVSTFGYYLGRLKKVPLQRIYQWRSEIKASRDINNEGKIFWWKYKEWKKNQS